MRWESTGFGFTEDVSVFVIVFGDSGEIDMFRGSGATCGRVSIRDGNCKNSISRQAGEPSVSGCVYKRNRRDRRIFRSRRRIGIKRIKRIKSGGVRRHRRFRRAGRSRSRQRRFKRTISPGARRSSYQNARVVGSVLFDLRTNQSTDCSGAANYDQRQKRRRNPAW